MSPRWPSLLVAAIISLYWSRVLWMALKMRRRTGRAANFLPGEPLGRALRLVWIPVVALWIVLPWLDAFQNKTPGRWPALAWSGAAVAAISLAATWICWKKMGRHWRMGIDPSEKPPLLITGPWARVRHPIYTLSSILMLATVAAVPTLPMAIVALIHLLLLQWEARREEKHLAAQYGEDYLTYCTRVGRFLPRI